MPNLPPGFMQIFAESLVLFRHVTLLSSSVCWLFEFQTWDIYVGFTLTACMVFGTGCSSELKSLYKARKECNSDIKFIILTVEVLIDDHCQCKSSHLSISKCICL